MNSMIKVLNSLGRGFVEFGEKGFVWGAQGKLLNRNVESLWFENCVTMPSYNVFLANTDNFSEILGCKDESISDSRPFGLASIEDTKVVWNSDFCQNPKSQVHRTARVIIVTDEDTSKDMFHRKQRDRKVWWRKFARNPSRFALGEAKKIGKNREIINITGTFDFGDIVLESIIYHQDAKKIQPQINELKVDLSGIHIVEHIASLDWGSLAMLCDAYEFTNDVGELKLHPKLSPYKVGFCLEPHEDEDDPKCQEKVRLVRYLNNLLKSKGLGTVLTRTRRGIDNFHVPLTISIDDASLQNGIVRVTSKLTTIAEAVHVTDLPKYVAARCS